MVTIEEAKASVQTAKQQIAEAQAKVPQVTKTTLREQGGIRGRQQIRNIEQVNKQISQQVNIVSQYEGQIKDIEQKYSSQQPSAYNQAIELVNRQFQGKKIVLADKSPEVKQIYAEIVSQKEIQKGLENVNELKGIASASGFDNIQEFISLQGFAKKKITEPTLTEQNLLMSLPSDLRKLQPIDVISKQSVYIPQNNISMITGKEAFTPPPQGLKTNIPSISNDFNVSSGKSSGVSGSTFNRVVNYLGGSGDFKKGYEKEIYNPNLKGFVSASEPSGQATSYFRQPTVEEAKKIKESQQKGSLLYYEPFVKKITTPQGILSYIDLASEKTLQAGEKISKQIETKLNVKDSFLFKQLGFVERPKEKKGFQFQEGVGYFKPSYFGEGTSTIIPVTSQDITRINPRDIAKGVISTAYTFALFEPVIRTGTVQQTESKFIYDVKKGRFILKSDIEDYLSQPVIERSGKTIRIRDLTFQDKAERVRNLLNNALTKEAREKALNLARKEYGKDFVKDFLAQETSYTTIGKVTPKPRTVEIDFLGTSGTELKGISGFGTASQYTGTGQYEKTEFVSNVIQKPKQEFKPLQDLKPLQLIGTAQQPKTKQLSKNLLDFKTQQDTKQVQKLKQISVSLLGIAQQFKQPQQFKQLLKQGQGTPQKQKSNQPPKKSLKPKPIIPLLPSGKARELLQRVKEEQFKVFVRRKKKDVEIGTFETSEGAKKGLLKTLTGGLEASGFIKKGERKLNVRELGFLGSSFTQSKVNPFRVIEIKERRLRRGTTGKQIQYFR